jgi:hypothetical protein
LPFGVSRTPRGLSPTGTSWYREVAPLMIASESLEVRAA